jgi:hypothetical protein
MMNKELMDKLQDYFLTQDQKTVCRLAASLMIDLNRILYATALPAKELDCLVFRVRHMIEELRNFADHDCKDELFLFKLNSDDLCDGDGLGGK